MKILDSLFLTGKWSTIFVLIENGIGEKSVRMGHHTPGYFPDQDIKEVADWGEKLTFAQAAGFFPTLDEKDYKKS